MKSYGSARVAAKKNPVGFSFDLPKKGLVRTLVFGGNPSHEFD
jgi:hypothetical protein